MDISNLEKLERYRHYLLYVRKLSPSTVRAYVSDYRKWQGYLEIHQGEKVKVTQEVLDDFLLWLHKRRQSPASINRLLSALKGFYRFLKESDTPFEQTKQLRKRKALPHHLTYREIEAFLSLSEKEGGWTGARDALLFEFLYSTGCRVSEVCRLEKRDFIGSSLLIRGKRGQERYVFLGEAARRALENYLRLDRCQEGPLFCNHRGDRLTSRGIFYIVDRYARRLGLTHKVTPHTFRHTFATHLLDEGANVREVQALLGHRSLSTTQIYTHTGLERLKRVYRKAHPHASKGKAIQMEKTANES